MDAELYKPFKVSFWMLSKFGMWQDGNQTWRYLICGHVLHFLFFDLNIASQIIYAINAEDLVDFTEAFALTVTVTTSMLKGFNFFFRIKSIKKSVETLESLLKFSLSKKNNSRKQIDLQIEKVCHIFKMIWFSTCFACFIGVLIPLHYNHLPYKLWFPFNTDSGEVGFWIASYYLVLNSFVSCAITIALDMLPITFMAFAIGLINELSDSLSEFGKFESKSKKVEQKPSKKETSFVGQQKLSTNVLAREIHKYIEIHIKIKEFVGEIHGNFETVIFFQGFMSSMILCTSAFSLTMVKCSLFENFLRLQFFITTDHRSIWGCILSYVHVADVAADIFALFLWK